MKNIVNLTPHDIVIVQEGERDTIIPASGTVARCAAKTERIGAVNGIPVTKTTFGSVENLPEGREDTVYIVSSLVAQAVRGRGDVFIPNEAVRDDKGKIVGCRSLGRI